MLRGNVVGGGILCAVLSLFVLSCGERTPTEPDLPTRVVAVPASDIFTSSPQLEPRELLIDGRATDIEWNVTGDPVLLLLRGSEGRGGDYYASVRALWSTDPFNGDSLALYLLLQWADARPDFLEQPLITSASWKNPDGTSPDCAVSDPLRDPTKWRRATDQHEDQVEIEIYSDADGSYPADRWRWGSGTTDPATPVSTTEFDNAGPEETFGENLHPTAGWSEDFYNSGSGWTRDVGLTTYEDNFVPGSFVPRFIAGKGGRDTRQNRGKPVSYMIWRPVAKRFEACDSLNPIRIEDASQRQKTWEPGDYVPSVTIGLPDSSQRDVVSRGGWDNGKWALEIRRFLVARTTDVRGRPEGLPRADDVHLYSGRTYGLRVRIYNSSKTRSSVSPIVPLYIRPSQ